MQTIINGGSTHIELIPGAVLKVTAIGGGSYAVLSASRTSGNTSFSGATTTLGGSASAGPFNGVVTIAIEVKGKASVSVLQPEVQALVSDAGKPFDALVAPLQRVALNAALSTTAALTATATGTFYKARVAWNNNGASGTAKLRIAVNTDNDVHGLMVGQSAKRRDHELTMGDAVILVCADPITRLTFSADGAIGSGLHSILVTFGG